MPSTPVPTTTLVSNAEEELRPHAETHEDGGIDPILGGIRYLGQTGSITHDGEDIDEEMPESVITLRTRGGTIQVVVTAAREMDTVAAADSNTLNLQAGYTLYMDGAQTASYGRSSATDTHNMNFTSNVLNEPLSTQYTTDGTFTWYLLNVPPGVHVFSLHMFVNPNTHAYFTGLITFFELLPIRRG